MIMINGGGGYAQCFMGTSPFFPHYPTNSELLINCRLSSNAEILIVSTDWAYKSGPNVQKRVCKVYHIPTELPFCIPQLVVGYMLHKRVSYWRGTFLRVRWMPKRMTKRILFWRGGERRGVTRPPSSYFEEALKCSRSQEHKKVDLAWMGNIFLATSKNNIMKTFFL